MRSLTFFHENHEEIHPERWCKSLGSYGSFTKKPLWGWRAIYIHHRVQYDLFEVAMMTSIFPNLKPCRCLDFAKTFDGLDFLSMCHLGYHDQHAEIDTYEDVPDANDFRKPI